MCVWGGGAADDGQCREWPGKYTATNWWDPATYSTHPSSGAPLPRKPPNQHASLQMVRCMSWRADFEFPGGRAGAGGEVTASHRPPLQLAAACSCRLSERAAAYSCCTPGWWRALQDPFIYLDARDPPVLHRLGHTGRDTGQSSP